MADPVWHYMTGGRPAGPVSLDELKALYAAGTVGPDNPVMQEGGGGWGPASGVRELSAPSPPAPSPVDVPLVECEKCAARISDAAERCPQCGHPQVTLVAREQGDELARCPQCGVLNRVRTRTDFLPGVCRGCRRSTAELFPEQQFEAQVDRLFAICSRVWNDFRTGIVVAGAVGGAALAWAVARVLEPSMVDVWAIFAGAIAGWCALPFFPLAYYFARIRGWRPLPPPNDGRPITAADWNAAAERAVLAGARPPWRDRAWAIGVGVVVAALLSRMVYIQRENAKVSVGNTITDTIKVTKNEGFFSHDVYLTNESTAAYGPSDLTVTVQYASGKRQAVGRQWATWGPGERKTVNVPASGRVERLELTGTIVNPAGGTGRVEASIDWRVKKP